MGLQTVLCLAGICAFARLLLKGEARRWFLFIASLLGVFLLQPALPIRDLDFWLPFLTIGLAAGVWVWISEPAERWTRSNLISGLAAVGWILALSLTRYLIPGGLVTPSQPPRIQEVLLLAGLGSALMVLLAWKYRFRSITAWLGIGVLILLLVALKIPAAGYWISIGLRTIHDQSTTRADALDIRWLGFSYLCFRMIHLLRDRQAGRSFGSNLRDTLIYLLFFPAFTAGPIDRLERFQKDLHSPGGPLAEDYTEGGKRLVLGLFKKFVIADSFAMLALGPNNAAQIRSAGWGWILLYAYALQIFFDFSGYTDLALGLARCLGIRLPENFNSPYLKTSLTAFWNNWHMTLTQWFRGYFFNPVTRALRRSKRKFSQNFILFFVQTSTMVLIGMWHGVSWNFLIWGLWHGLGLFAQSRYSAWISPRMAWMENRPRWRAAFAAAGGLLTFHYVALGWVWFALADTALSVKVFTRLLGG